MDKVRFGNPEAAYPDGVTNLMIASTSSERLLILSQYLTQEPDLTRKDETDHDALDYAQDQGPDQAVRLLEQDKTPIYYEIGDKRYLLNFSSVYQIIQVLGSGGFAEVSLARTSDGQLVAVKKFIFNNESFTEEKFFNQRLNEVSDVALVKYLDSFTIFGLAEIDCLVFEYVEGKTLNDYIFPNVTALKEFFLEYLRVIGKLNEIGIQHGDLHGSNLMIDSTGQLRIIVMMIAPWIYMKR